MKRHCSNTVQVTLNRRSLKNERDHSANAMLKLHHTFNAWSLEVALEPPARTSLALLQKVRGFVISIKQRNIVRDFEDVCFSKMPNRTFELQKIARFSFELRARHRCNFAVGGGAIRDGLEKA